MTSHVETVQLEIESCDVIHFGLIKNAIIRYYTNIKNQIQLI